MNALREAGEGGATLDAIIAPIIEDKGLQSVAAPTIRRLVMIVLSGLKRRKIVTGERGDAAAMAINGLGSKQLADINDEAADYSAKNGPSPDVRPIASDYEREEPMIRLDGQKFIPSNAEAENEAQSDRANKRGLVLALPVKRIHLVTLDSTRQQSGSQSTGSMAKPKTRSSRN
jgi:hypothetical protein